MARALTFGVLLATLACADLWAIDRPNIVLIFADDISARELPIYKSSVWSPPTGGDTSDPAFQAQTPVLDRMAQEGCWIKTAWAAVVCSPSRAMMMTGRYAHLHKWWSNKDKGKYVGENGKLTTWPLYASSPIQRLIATGSTGTKARNRSSVATRSCVMDEESGGTWHPNRTI